MGHNPRVDLCPISIKKMKKKMENFWRNGVSGKMEKKEGKNGQMAAGGGWKWLAVVRWVVGKWWVAVVCGGFGL
jgi:hypothetical protein